MWAFHLVKLCVTNLLGHYLLVCKMMLESGRTTTTNDCTQPVVVYHCVKLQTCVFGKHSTILTGAEVLFTRLHRCILTNLSFLCMQLNYYKQPNRLGHEIDGLLLLTINDNASYFIAGDD